MEKFTWKPEWYCEWWNVLITGWSHRPQGDKQIQEDRQRSSFRKAAGFLQVCTSILTALARGFKLILLEKAQSSQLDLYPLKPNSWCPRKTVTAPRQSGHSQQLGSTCSAGLDACMPPRSCLFPVPPPPDYSYTWCIGQYLKASVFAWESVPQRDVCLCKLEMRFRPSSDAGWFMLANKGLTNPGEQPRPHRPFFLGLYKVLWTSDLGIPPN